MIQRRHIILPQMSKIKRQDTKSSVKMMITEDDAEEESGKIDGMLCLFII